MKPRLLSSNNSLKRGGQTADMDSELTYDYSRDFFKVARTDSHINCKEPDLKMRITTSSCMLDPSIRSNFPMPNRSLGSSATNSNEAHGALLGSHAVSEPRLLENELLLTRNPQCSGRNPLTMPFLQQPCFCRHSDAAFRDRNDGSVLAPPPNFTSSQFRELGHQALVFKCIMSGVHVPAELIFPFCNSVFGLANIQTAPNIGWGNYNLSFANNVDAEPGRCRRTDGKKWRCGRKVVPNQKYCERHMHRGRNRARKVAENQAASSESTAIVGLCTAAVPCNTVPSNLHPSILLNNQQCDTSRLSAKDYRYLNEATQFVTDLGSEQIDFLGSIPGNLREVGPESHNLWERTISTKQQQRHSVFGNGFGTEAAHVTCQSEGHLRRPGDPSRLSCSGMEEDMSNCSSSMTKLPISTPMTPSDFNTSNANSPHSKLSPSPLKLSMFSVGKDDPMGVDPTHMAIWILKKVTGRQIGYPSYGKLRF